MTDAAVVLVGHENHWFDYILNPIRNIIRNELDYGQCYISPKILHKSNISVRIWSSNAETISYVQNQWTKRYAVDIFLYEIDKKGDERFYQQFYRDIERIYQSLFENSIVQTSAQHGNDALIANKFYDGVVENIIINDFNEGEEEIDGLNVCKFEFFVTLSRET